MKLHFQCAEQAMSTSNLSEYCACHEIFKFKIAAETLWIASANIKTIRGLIRPWSEHEIVVISHPPLRRPYSSHLGDAFCIEKYNISRSGYLTNCCLPRKVTIQVHQILRLPRKMNLMINPRLIWNVISNAQSKQSQPRTSPNAAPATQNESHD